MLLISTGIRKGGRALWDGEELGKVSHIYVLTLPPAEGVGVLG